MPSKVRREALKALGGLATVATLAGCIGDDDDDDDIEAVEDPDGEPVPEVEFVTEPSSDSPIAYEYSTRIASAWEELGLEVNHNPVDFHARTEQVIGEQDYDIMQVGWGGAPDRIDPQYFIYSLYHSSESDPGQFNFINYENPDYDELAEQQSRVFDEDERRELIHECLAILDEDQPRSTPFAPTIADPYIADRVSGYSEMPGQDSLSFMNVMNVELSGDDQTFRVGSTDIPESINPLVTTTIRNRDALRLMYDRLFRINPDFEPEPWAVEDYEQLDDETIELTIRDDMSFHDGEPVTAEDIAFSFDYQAEHAPLTSATLAPVSQAEVIDDYTVRVDLEHPHAPIFANSFCYMFVLPQHIWEDIPDSVDADEPSEYPNPEPVGSGPFEFEYFEADEELRLTRNDDFYRPPNIEELVWVTGPQSAMYDLIETGEIEAFAAGTGHAPDTTDRLREEDEIDIYEVESHGVQDIAYNNAREPFDDRAMRQALDYAIPRQEIVEEVYLGYANAEYSHITEANEFWHNPDVEKHGGDMDLARQELEDAGYQWDEDGRLHYPPE